MCDAHTHLWMNGLEQVTISPRMQNKSSRILHSIGEGLFKVQALFHVTDSPSFIHSAELRLFSSCLKSLHVTDKTYLPALVSFLQALCVSQERFARPRVHVEWGTVSYHIH